MRMRLGMTMGFAAGYYLGAKAGRQRYEQMNKWLGRVRRSETFETASDKARAVIDLGVERAKDAVDGIADGATDTNVPTIDVTTPDGETVPFRP